MTAGRDFDQSDEEEFMFEVKNSTICKSLFFGSNLMPVGPCQKEELK